MTPTAIIALVMQILALAPTLVQAAAAVKELGDMVSDGKEPTQAELDALIERVKAQSGEIQKIAADDAGQQEPDPQP